MLAAAAGGGATNSFLALSAVLYTPQAAGIPTISQAATMSRGEVVLVSDMVCFHFLAA